MRKFVVLAWFLTTLLSPPSALARDYKRLASVEAYCAATDVQETTGRALWRIGFKAEFEGITRAITVTVVPLMFRPECDERVAYLQSRLREIGDPNEIPLSTFHRAAKVDPRTQEASFALYRLNRRNGVESVFFDPRDMRETDGYAPNDSVMYVLEVALNRFAQELRDSRWWQTNRPYWLF